MRKLLTGCLWLSLALGAAAQNAPYDFPAPQGWSTEKFAFPLKFAPNIPFNGTEELHLSPGWGKSESDEYWSYVFVWYLDKPGNVGANALNDCLAQYYTGLYLANLGNKPNPPAGFTHADLKPGIPNTYDNGYEGTITTLDFMTGKPIKFFVRMAIRPLADGHTVFLNEVSPKPYPQPVWQTLDGVIHSFKLN